MSATDEKALAINPVENFRLATDVAAVCKQIVVATALKIQGRKYVRVEGWESIAVAHGCVPSVGSVEWVDAGDGIGGFRAIAELRRVNDGHVISTAEGFVGMDEPVWFGGKVQILDGFREYERRPDYAIRAMAQTRAISRVCRSAFAHVVVLMDAGLETTPADEVPESGFEPKGGTPAWKIEAQRELSDASANIVEAKEETKTRQTTGSWRDAEIPFGKNKGVPLGNLSAQSLHWYATDWLDSKVSSAEPIRGSDKALVEALLEYRREHSASGVTA